MLSKNEMPLSMITYKQQHQIETAVDILFLSDFRHTQASSTPTVRRPYLAASENHFTGGGAQHTQLTTKTSAMDVASFVKGVKAKI